MKLKGYRINFPDPREKNSCKVVVQDCPSRRGLVSEATKSSSHTSLLASLLIVRFSFLVVFERYFPADR